MAYHERIDTVRSLMASCWSWSHWPEYEAGTYHSAWRLTVKLARNVDRSARLITRHLADGSYRLVPVDLGMMRFHS